MFLETSSFIVTDACTCMYLFFFLLECLFGRAPFASRTFKELENKIWDSKPVEVIVYNQLEMSVNQ